MIRISDLKLPLSYTEQDLHTQAAKRLKITPSQIQHLTLFRRSIDARNKQNIHFICTVDLALPNEAAVLKRCPKAKRVLPYHYSLPTSKPLAVPPVIVGFGPAGLFAALLLARAGQKPIVIERGGPVQQRTAAVRTFWQGGPLDAESNVQFGEGGAGTFSDGKLNTGTKDPRARQVLLELVQAGAPEEILYRAKPHVGTDYLAQIVQTMRKTILSLGGQVQFHTKLTALHAKHGALTGITVQPQNAASYRIDTNHLILAIGHSARDTYEMLHESGLVQLTPKPFSVGARIEHPQSRIDQMQFGCFAGHPALGAAEYKQATHLPNGRGVYTFCMCPGGVVVASASEAGGVVTNGMSNFARGGENANSAVLVSVTPQDFGSEHPLAGMHFQRRLEQTAYEMGGNTYAAPAQHVGDFLQNRATGKIAEITPTYQRGVIPGNISRCFPPELADSLRAGIAQIDRAMPGFAHPQALLTAVETRSSAPVRIPRGADLQSVTLSGLYPCGEGAGYAGGIVSAAVDGIKCAEAILHTTQ